MYLLTPVSLFLGRCTIFMNLRASISRHFTYVNKPGPAHLIIFFVAAALLTFVISDNRAAAEVLFQSPQSPPAQEPPPPAPQPQPEQQPSFEQQPQPPVEPQPQPATEAVTPVSPVEESPSSVMPAGSEPPPLPPPTPDPRAGRTREDTFLDETDEAGESNFILDLVELVDTVVVSGAYLWLCCGAILLLLIPLAFLFLQIRGQIKLQQQDRL